MSMFKDSAMSTGSSSWFGHGNEPQKYIFTLQEGAAEDVEILSKKGANLCAIRKLGFKVPEGFILSSELSVEFSKIGGRSLPGKVRHDIKDAIYNLERASGKMWGSGNGLAPLLLSVRSGALLTPNTLVTADDVTANGYSAAYDLLENLAAPDSWCIPGAKESCHGIGLNDRVVEHLANLTSVKFAYNSYAHFLLRFGTLIMGASRDDYLGVLRMFVHETGRAGSELTGNDLKSIVSEFKEIRAVPEDPFEQLEMAICECYECWFAPEAMRYRKDALGSAEDMGTAIIVQSMVFGGNGVCFSRNPFTGQPGIYGNFWTRDGAKVNLDGSVTSLDTQAYSTVLDLAQKLESHFLDMMQFEYIIGDDEQLYIVHATAGRRTPKASLKIAVDLVREKIASPREALFRLDARSVEHFLQPQLHPDDLQRVPFTSGIAASSGVVTGPVVFDGETCIEMAGLGSNAAVTTVAGGGVLGSVGGAVSGGVILCVQNCTYLDAQALRAAAGVVTLGGGMVSDAAILCRGMGKPCVTAVGRNMEFVTSQDGKVSLCSATGEVLSEGCTATLDGGHGRLLIDTCPTITLCNDQDFLTLLSWADEFRNMRINASIAAPAAVTPALISLAHQMGADGFDCISTDFMFDAINGDNKDLLLMRTVLLLRTREQRLPHLQELCLRQRSILGNLLRAVQGKAVSIKLLDRRLDEFFDGITDQDIQQLANHMPAGVTEVDVKQQLFRIEMQRTYEACRGSKMVSLCPELLEMQVHAIIASVLDLLEEGILTPPTILIPNVCTSRELDAAVELISNEAQKVIMEFQQRAGGSTAVANLPFIGQCYTVAAEFCNPRICVRAETCAEIVSSVAFDTQDLTGNMFGISRAEARKCFPQYIFKGVYLADPFVSLDDQAVGTVMDMAIKKLRSVVPSMHCSVTEGEHTCDFRSIAILHEMGIDAISCHPDRIPIARIGAAQAAIKNAMKYQSSAAGLEDMLSQMVLYL